MHFPNMPSFLNRFPRFGDQLRDFRTLRGISVEQIAEAAGITPSAVRDIEAGKRPAPPEDIALAMAGALQLGKKDRNMFLDAAKMESSAMSALLGQPDPKPSQRSMSAAILVFLIADIRGYTRFTQEHGDRAAAALTARFAELSRAMVEDRDGHLVEVRGDEILAVFASAHQALLAAQAMQARFAEESRVHPDMPLYVGIGLDLGEAVQVDQGYRGAALNRAARLCSLAGAGEVLVSTGVAYVAPQVEGVTFRSRGQEMLKGFDGPTPILLAAPSLTIEAGGEEA